MLTIETERLTLRPFTERDIDELYQVLDTHPDVWKFAPGFQRTKEQRAELLRYRILQHDRNGFGEFAVVLKSDGRLVGYCGLQLYLWERKPVSTPEIELHYKLGRDYWGKGYATEACRAALAFGYTKLRLHRVVTWTHRENERSVALLKRLGMVVQDDPNDPNGVIGILENERFSS